MKRYVALVALALLPLWGCTQPAEAPANNNANTTANANLTAAATPTPADSALQDQERQIWDALKRQDYDAFGQMLADEFIYVTNDGLHDKAATIKAVKDYAPSEINFSEWKVIPIDQDASVVAYQVTQKATANGKPLPETPFRAASVWVKRGGKWVAIFHQDTDIAPPSATPTPATANTNANTNAHPAASPAASPAEPTNPTDKEKQIWAELKRKDYNAFASDLADNAFEIEPDGVYDKAGSVKGVQAFDFSKFTLSDFKEVKIDDDASIVTYVVKGGKVPERHSTVWTKKSGTWLALLHEGTPQGPPMSAAANAKASPSPAAKAPSPAAK